MIVEIRSTGSQTVFPPSVHPSGEPIEWDTEGAEPSLVDPIDLLASVERLEKGVRATLGDDPQPQSVMPTTRNGPAIVGAVHSLQSSDREIRCLAAMQRIDVTDHNDGSRRLFAYACRAVEHDLDDVTALKFIRQIAAVLPFPRHWSDAEITCRLRDAERRCTRGGAVVTNPDGSIALGALDPQSGRIVLSRKNTKPTAEAFLQDYYDHPDGPTLITRDNSLMEWRGNCYVEIEDAAIEHQLQAWLPNALDYAPGRNGKPQLAQFESNPKTISDARKAIKSLTFHSADITAPAWLQEPATTLPANEILACRTKLLHLPSLTTLEPTPTFFNTTALEYDYDAAAPVPSAWNGFLDQLFQSDEESRKLLQEWFGYLLTGDTSQQKTLLIVGPKRSGKGTIGRLLTELIGKGNVCSPTMSSLAEPFGMAPLVGKTLVLVSDARLRGKKDVRFLELFLAITGGDAVSVNRKYKDHLQTVLSTRFVILTNELPCLPDASNAAASRLSVIQLTESFYGREDLQLIEKLLAELPSILNWAIEGRLRLHKQGRFTIPSSSQELVTAIQELSSPVAAFVTERCDVGAGRRVLVSELWEAFRDFCIRQGQHPGYLSYFGRDLKAAVAGVTRRRNGGGLAFYDGIGLKPHPPMDE